MKNSISICSNSPRAEGVISWRHFVAERLPYLGDAERNFDTRSIDDVAEVREDALRRFGAQIDLAGVILNGAGIGFEHQIELLGFGKSARFLGFRGDDPGKKRSIFDSRVLDDFGFRAEGLGRVLFTFGFARRVGKEGVRRSVGVRRVDIDHDMVEAEALLGFPVVNHWVGEPADVAGGDPHLGIHDDRGIKPHHLKEIVVGADVGGADDVVPPGILKVAFEFDAEGPVIPEPIDAAVDLRRLEDEAAPFAKRDEAVHFRARRGGCGGFGGVLRLVRHGESFGGPSPTAHWHCASGGKIGECSGFSARRGGSSLHQAGKTSLVGSF